MRLGDIAKEHKETFKGDKKDIPLVGLEHLIGGELRFTKYDINTDNTFTKVFRKGDILFGRRRAYLKKAAIAEFSGICSGDITVIEAIDGKVDPKLLPFIIQNDALFDFAVSRSAGGLSPRVKWEHLANYEFELPSIDEQRVLADKLWAAYNLKEAYKKMIDATDEMVKSQFIEMLNRKTAMDTLENISTYIGKGITPKYVNDSSIVVINQACVYWDGLNLENVKFHNEAIQPNKRYLQSEDILINATGSGTLGRSCIFRTQSDGKQYISDSHVIVIRSNNQIVLPEVLTMYFSLTDTQSDIYRHYVTGSTNQIDIVLTSFKKMPAPIPDLVEQKQFVLILKQADKSKFEFKKAIENIDRVIKSLLQ